MRTANAKNLTLVKETSSGENLREQTSAIRTASDDIGRESWAMRHGAAYLAPGYVLVPELSTKGGSEMEGYRIKPIEDGEKRNKTKGDTGRMSTISFRRRLDHPELEKAARTAISGARWTLDKHAARFIINGTYFVTDTEREALENELEEPRRAAELCNKMAKELNSPRRTSIDIFAFELDVNDKKIAIRVAEAIRERLIGLKESFTSKDRYAYPNALSVCHHMADMVGGGQREIIRLALASAESQRPLMIAYYGGKKGVGEVMRAYKDKLPDFDYSSIDTAIEMFRPSEN